MFCPFSARFEQLIRFFKCSNWSTAYFNFKILKISLYDFELANLRIFSTIFPITSIHIKIKILNNSGL